MAVKYSTGAVNYRSAEGSSRKMVEDCVLDIWSGTAPATADEAPTGTKLCRVTLASGSVATTDRSTPQKGKIVVNSHLVTDTFDIDVTVDGVGPTSYNFLGSAPADHTLVLIAAWLARVLNDIPQLQAISDGVDSVYVQHRVDGQTFTIADGGSTTPMTVTNALLAAARVNTIQFGPSTAGVISKTTDVWSGVNLATGVAGYFRFVLPNDTAVLSTTEVRVQGTIATSGADLNMSNTTLTISATTTIDTATITMPKS